MIGLLVVVVFQAVDPGQHTAVSSVKIGAGRGSKGHDAMVIEFFGAAVEEEQLGVGIKRSDFFVVLHRIAQKDVILIHWC